MEVPDSEQVLDAPLKIFIWPWLKAKIVARAKEKDVSVSRWVRRVLQRAISELERDRA